MDIKCKDSKNMGSFMMPPTHPNQQSYVKHETHCNLNIFCLTQTLVSGLAISFALGLRNHVERRSTKSWRGARWKSYLWKRNKREIKIRKFKRRSWWWWKRSSGKKRGKGQEIIRTEWVTAPTATQIISSQCVSFQISRVCSTLEDCFSGFVSRSDRTGEGAR